MFHKPKMWRSIPLELCAQVEWNFTFSEIYHAPLNSKLNFLEDPLEPQSHSNPLNQS